MKKTVFLAMAIFFCFYGVAISGELRLQDGNGQDLGILINVYDSEPIRKYVSYIPSADVFVTLQENMVESPYVTFMTSKAIFYTESGCNGTRFIDSPISRFIYWEKRINRFFVWDGQTTPKVLTGKSYVESECVATVDQVHLKAYTLTEITLPFTLPINPPISVVNVSEISSLEQRVSAIEQALANCNCGSEPTNISLSTLKAEASNKQVRLNWQTESETDNAGFNVWRAEGFKKVNAEVIPADGSSVSGAEYDFVDQWVLNGKRYFYLLEDIDTNGISTFHGPVKAVPRWFK